MVVVACDVEVAELTLDIAGQREQRRIGLAARKGMFAQLRGEPMALALLDELHALQQGIGRHVRLPAYARHQSTGLIQPALIAPQFCQQGRCLRVFGMAR